MSDTPSTDDDWSKIDRTTRPREFVNYLDLMTGLDAIQAYKRRSYDLLRLRPAQRVLDVGCGTGDDVRAMAALVGPSGRAVGVDYSDTMITEAKKRSAGLKLAVEFHTGTALQLPFDDASFDATRADRVFQHLTDPNLAIREMIRVTRSGGRVGAMDPDWETLVVDSSDRPVTQRVLAANLSKHVNPSSGRELYSLFHTSGLREVDLISVTIPMLSLSLAESVISLRDSVKSATEKGAISRDGGLKWLGELEKRDREGHFFSSITGFGLFGTKP